MAQSGFWKPGDEPPSSVPVAKKSTSPAAPAVGDVVGAGTGTQKSPKRAVSAETMKMKFMQRKKRDETIESPVEAAQTGLMTSPMGVVDEETANISFKEGGDGSTADIAPRKDFRWRLSVSLAPELPLEGALECTPTAMDVKSHPLCRRSFNGFNKAVERAYEEARGDPQSSKRAKRLESEAIGNDEMANFYANRVKKQQEKSGGNKRQGSAAAGKAPTRISGSGGGNSKGAASQKRKRR